MLQKVDKTQPTLTGYAKIIEAFKSLIDEKEFTAITWKDIANRAEVNQCLIYRYGVQGESGVPVKEYIF